MRGDAVGEDLDVLPNTSGYIGIGAQPVIELRPGFELGYRGRTNHVAIIVGQGTADQEMAVRLEPARMLEMGGARRETTLRRRRISTIACDDQPLHDLSLLP